MKAVNPRKVQLSLEAAVSALRQGDWARSAASCREVLALAPAAVDAWHILANAEFQRANLTAARTAADKALELAPKNAQLWLLRANIHDRSGARDAALSDCHQASALGDGGAPLYFQLARIYRRLGATPQAIEAFDRGLALKPDEGRIWFNRGNALGEVGRMDDALESYRQATRLLPDFPDAWFNLGTALLGMGRAEAAVPVFEHLLTLQPTHGDALINLGNAWRHQGRDDLAAAAYLRALASDPGRAETHNNLASILLAKGDMAAALQHFDAAIGAAPTQVLFYLGKATALKQAGRLAEALAVFDQAVAVAPTHVEANTSRSLCRLLAGDLPEGLLEYEWRWQSPDLADIRPNFAKPLWLGQESIRGQRILVRWEQGFGDTIQFCRYVALLNQMGAEVILQVQPPLLSLLRGLSGRGTLLAEGQALPEFDCYIPMLSLPLACRTTLASIPAAPRYLSVDPDRLAVWRERLGEVRGLRVGLAWSGRPQHKNDLQRSLSLAQFLTALPEGPDYYVLQKDVRESDVAVLREQSRMINPAVHFEDFSDTAAVCELMDLIISVDTSIAHLAGALGRPFWLLLPFVPDWRWLMGGTETPWYPSALLFRQGDDKSWSPVLEKVRMALAKKQNDFAKG